MREFTLLRVSVMQLLGLCRFAKKGFLQPDNTALYAISHKIMGSRNERNKRFCHSNSIGKGEAFHGLM